MYPRCDAETGLYGYWDRKGWVIAPEFRYAHRFCGGHAAIEAIDRRPGLIGTDGVLVMLDSICGGRRPFADEYSSFTGFNAEHYGNSSYAVVRTGSRRRSNWGLIDARLNYIPLPDDAFAHASRVQVYGEYLIIGRKGRSGSESPDGLFSLADMATILPVRYSCIYPSDDPIWAIAEPRVEGDPAAPRFGFYDLRSRAFLPGKYWEASSFSCGFGARRRVEEEGWSFVDEDLDPVFDAVFDGVGRFAYGLAAFYQGCDAGYLDTTGRTRLLLPYDDLQPFNEFGLAIANRDQLEWDIDIIDRKGKLQIRGLETCVYWEGDFPYYEISKAGEEQLLDPSMNRIY